MKKFTYKESLKVVEKLLFACWDIFQAYLSDGLQLRNWEYRACRSHLFARSGTPSWK